MGAKHVCFICQKAFNAPFGTKGPTKCPECGHSLEILSQRFRPPKKREKEKWDMVKFLVDHGFYFNHIYATPAGGDFIKYPENMQEAKEFVVKYHAQAVKSR
ncbi:hypothetical protein [Hymenobacter sp. UYCo722]|uniref:hypothetical protein n=1 Tax=Hymenobacter sp. UYCo722 TaxID=3156335 RepID=UPI00339610BA